MASRREPPRRRRRRSGGSDLGSRILVAIPAIAFAITIIYFGGATFALGALALGLVCIHELFTMLEKMRPVRLAGFLGISGLVAAAALGDDASVLLALVAFLPVLFLLTLASPIRERISLSLAATVLGVYWIGLALANAVLLRGLDHGGALVFMVLLGTFAGDTGAYLGGRAFGTRRLAPRVSPNKTWEGLGIGMLVCIGAVWYASVPAQHCRLVREGGEVLATVTLPDGAFDCAITDDQQTLYAVTADYTDPQAMFTGKTGRLFEIPLSSGQ